MKKKIFLDIKYTSFLDIENKSIDEIIQDSRKSRSQDYNKAVKNFDFNQTDNIKLIDELHKKHLKGKIKKGARRRFDV